MRPVSYVIGAGVAIAVVYWPPKAQTPLQDDESPALGAFTVQQAQTMQTHAGKHLSVVAQKYQCHECTQRHRRHMCRQQRTDKVTESKFVCESATVAAVEIGTVPEIKSRETCTAGYQPVDCAALSFKVLSFRISYRI